MSEEKVQVECPGCGIDYYISRSTLGRKAKCRNCKEKFTVEFNNNYTSQKNNSVKSNNTPWYHRDLDINPSNKDLIIASAIGLLFLLVLYISFRFQNEETDQNTPEKTAQKDRSNQSEQSYGKKENKNQAQLDQTTNSNSQQSGTNHKVKELKNEVSKLKEQVTELKKNNQPKIANKYEKYRVKEKKGNIDNPENTQEIHKLAKRIRKGTVTVIPFNKYGNKMGHGSGFFYKGGDIITNYHVVKGADHVKVETIDGNRYQVTDVDSFGTSVDLVQLDTNIPDSAVKRLPISTKLPNYGEKIIVVGSPGSARLRGTVTTGHISSIRQIKNQKYLQIDASISSGSSGSPVVNMKGEIVGVVKSKANFAENISFAIPAEKVYQLKSYNKRKSLLKKRKQRQKELKGKAEKHQKRKNYGRAVYYYKKYLKNNKYDRKAYTNLGWSYLGLKKYDKAEEALYMAMTLGETSYSLTYGLGVASAGKGRYFTAERFLKSTIKKKPKAELPYYFLGITYLSLHQKYPLLGYDESVKVIIKKLKRMNSKYARKLLKLLNN